MGSSFTTKWPATCLVRHLWWFGWNHTCWKRFWVFRCQSVKNWKCHRITQTMQSIWRRWLWFNSSSSFFLLLFFFFYLISPNEAQALRQQTFPSFAISYSHLQVLPLLFQEENLLSSWLTELFFFPFLETLSWLVGFFSWSFLWDRIAKFHASPP